MGIASPLPPGSTPAPAKAPRQPTHFAPAERATPAALRAEFSYISRDPVIDALLHSVLGLVAVLNEQRQVLTLNVRLLERLGVSDAATVFGLRLGEAVGCRHAHASPGGCGTSEFCSTCGAAIALMTSLAQDVPVERVCAIDLEHPIRGSDHLYFRAQVCPLRRRSRRVLLVFIQDVTEEQRRALLEQTFFHDVKNTLCAMLAAGELLAGSSRQGDPELTTTLVRMTQRLAREVELQRCLVTFRTEQFESRPSRIALDGFCDDLVRTCEHHPAAAGKQLQVAPFATPVPEVETDDALLRRIVQNMLVNALEATPAGGTVRITCTAAADGTVIEVWNAGVIAPDVARRIFQRNFSTKGALGRGLGTYSMKLLGENLLGGQVDFASDAAGGTRFRLRLPARARGGRSSARQRPERRA
jgi:signal transduction histidine kinase